MSPNSAANSAVPRTTRGAARAMAPPLYETGFHAATSANEKFTVESLNLTAVMSGLMVLFVTLTHQPPAETPGHSQGGASRKRPTTFSRVMGGSTAGLACSGSSSPSALIETVHRGWRVRLRDGRA